MKIITDLENWQKTRKSLKGSVGFVPTMGHLHEGHASLATRSVSENDATVVSIFVNPTQFNQPADYEKYQRTMEADAALLEKMGVDYIITPTKEMMYPDNYEVQVSETVLSQELEGEFRPGHFTGMLTVVIKLLNIAQADRAYFGEKDFQQLLLVQKMVKALFVPTEIIPCETVRAQSGLALSSRNGRLSPPQQEKAKVLAQLLMSDLSDEAVLKELKKEGFKPEYVSTQWGRRLAAAWFHDVRLIDNVPFAKEKKNVARS